MITAQEIEQATAGRWLVNHLKPEAKLIGATHDSRRSTTAQIFFSLQGKRGYGHEFIDFNSYQPQLIVLDKPAELSWYGGSILLVEDVVVALAQLGRFCVEKYQPKVVAITGSFGKSSTKEFMAQALGRSLSVLSSEGSYNNEIGIPLTLLNLEAQHRVVVLEYAARKKGDIAYLCRIAQPHIAVVTGIGHAHIGEFKSLDNIYETKGEILTHLHDQGLAIVNADDQRLFEQTQNLRRVGFGFKNGNLRATHKVFDASNKMHLEVPPEAPFGMPLEIPLEMSFTASFDGQQIELSSHALGVHVPLNLLPAWAVFRELGLTDDAFKTAVSSYQPKLTGRMQPHQLPAGAVILDDTYNSSPETIVNLLQTMAKMPAKRRIAVLGGLAELEEDLTDATQIIQRAITPAITECLIYAPHQPQFRGQLPQVDSIKDFSSLEQLYSYLRWFLIPGTIIGIKAARSAHLERLVYMLRSERVDCKLLSCSLIIQCVACPKLRTQA